jgi:hypothetical protein
MIFSVNHFYAIQVPVSLPYKGQYLKLTFTLSPSKEGNVVKSIWGLYNFMDVPLTSLAILSISFSKSIFMGPSLYN